MELPDVKFALQNCQNQLSNLVIGLQLPADQRSYSLAPIIWSYIGETFVLLTVFAFFGGVCVYFRDFLFRDGAPFLVPIFLLLLFSDQTRYYFTSIHDVDKKFFSWSSYCLRGELGWAFDFATYAAMYVPVALVISGLLAINRRVSKADFDLYKVGFGYQGDLDVIEGVFKWLRVVAISFFFIWPITNKLDENANILYAIQAMALFTLIAIVYIWALYIFRRIDIWYESKRNEIRLQLAEEKGVDPNQILEHDISEKGIQPNPYRKHIGQHRTLALANLGAILLPVFGFLGTWSDMPQTERLISSPQMPTTDNTILEQATQCFAVIFN